MDGIAGASAGTVGTLAAVNPWLGAASAVLGFAAQQNAEGSALPPPGSRLDSGATVNSAIGDTGWTVATGGSNATGASSIPWAWVLGIGAFVFLWKK